MCGEPLGLNSANILRNLRCSKDGWYRRREELEAAGTVGRYISCAEWEVLIQVVIVFRARCQTLVSRLSAAHQRLHVCHLQPRDHALRQARPDGFGRDVTSGRALDRLSEADADEPSARALRQAPGGRRGCRESCCGGATCAGRRRLAGGGSSGGTNMDGGRRVGGGFAPAGLAACWWAS